MLIIQSQQIYFTRILVFHDFILSSNNVVFDNGKNVGASKAIAKKSSKVLKKKKW